MRFQDRRAAGRELAARLSAYADREDVVVLGLPRGGVPVAYEVARVLDAPLDLLVVRKLGVPGREELAFGAIASGGVRVLNRDLIAACELTPALIDAVIRREARELERRERSYRGQLAPLAVSGRSVFVVDDGIATGATVRAAIAALRARAAGEITVAVPAAAPQTCSAIGELVDTIVCIYTPESFIAVGNCYTDFAPTTDLEVRELLEVARGAV